MTIKQTIAQIKSHLLNSECEQRLFSIRVHPDRYPAVIKRMRLGHWFVIQDLPEGKLRGCFLKSSATLSDLRKALIK